MRKKPTLVLLLAALSVAAGFWMFRPEAGKPPGPAPVQPRHEATVTGDGDSAATPPGEKPGADAATRPASPPDSKEAAAIESPADLRDKADRLMAAGNFREGIDALRAATKADPSVRNLDYLGSVLAGLMAFDEALLYLRQAAALDPGNADRWLQMATLYYRVTDPGAAWDAERRAVAAEPGLELGWDAHGNRVRKGDTAPRKR
jgi:hypothetical protein